jgi:hypothetical protein
LEDQSPLPPEAAPADELSEESSAIHAQGSARGECAERGKSAGQQMTHRNKQNTECIAFGNLTLRDLDFSIEKPCGFWHSIKMRCGTCWLFFCAAVACWLVSCEVPQPRHAVFNEAVFSKTSGSGTGVVMGQAYAEMKSGLIRYTQNDTVDLVPVNAYTTEIMERRFAHGVKLSPPDPRFNRYVRVANTDSLGHFAFRGVPPGEYYVGTTVDWSDWNWGYDAEGAPYKITIQYHGPIYQRISVSNGQTVRVTNWINGKERSE